MNRKNIVLLFVVILGFVSALGCSESDEDADVNTSVETENVQEGEAKATQEEKPVSTEENEAEKPVSTETEKADIVNLEETNAEEGVPEEEPEEDIESRMRQIEEEDKDEESTAPTISSEDLVWINVMTGDLRDMQADMEDVSRAASNNDIASLSVYSDNLYTSTNTAIDHCDKYDVSADLQPVEDEYRLAMVAYNWAAVYCYAGVESYNAGNAAEAAASFSDATEFINSGIEHTSKANDLMMEYNEDHGV